MLSKTEDLKLSNLQVNTDKEMAAKKLSPVLKTVAGWKTDNIRVKGVEKSQPSGSQMDRLKITRSPPVLFEHWLSASVSQYKITVEDEMKKKRQKRAAGKEVLSRLCFILYSDRASGEEDEAGVNRDRVNRKQALGFHLNLKKQSNKLGTLFITNMKLCFLPPHTSKWKPAGKK